MNRALITTLLVLVIVSVATYLAVLYGKGYRLNLGGEGNKIIAGTGLLVLTSTPDGASVFVDDNLTTATNDTINLPPGEYDVRIEKDGYFAWKKRVVLKKEAVTKTDTLLFPSVPRLEAITLVGAEEPLTDPAGNLIAYKVSSSSAQNNGIYIMSLTNRPLFPIGTSSQQIASDRLDDFSKAQLEFSPDGQEMLATVPTTTSKRVYLLQTNTLNQNPQNVTVTVAQLRRQWETEKNAKQDKIIASFPRKSKPFMTRYFANMKISPEQDKIMYVASESAAIPRFIAPPLPSTNSTSETRELKKGSVYVYQIKEDKNYHFYTPTEGEASPNFIWHPSSSHVVFIKGNRVYAREYDGGNETTLYAGPFNGDFLYPWPDGSGVVIRTNLNDESVPPNLYKIGLK